MAILYMVKNAVLCNVCRAEAACFRKMKTKMNTHQVPAKSELAITILGRQFDTNMLLLINYNGVLKAVVCCT